jgi:mono/diheme cytochrome c family protein
MDVKAPAGRLPILGEGERTTNWAWLPGESMMRVHGVRLALAALAAGALVGAALAQPRVDIGKREFEAKCAVCHGVDGRGAGPYADELKRPLPDLTTMARRNGGVFPVKATFALIEGAGKGHGTRDMPVWGNDYTERANELMPDLPFNQASYVRTRINALVEYLTLIQVK